jgi:hypothetical protein
LFTLQESWEDVVKEGGPPAETIVDLLFIAANEGAETISHYILDFDEDHTHALNSTGSNPPAPSNTAARSSSGSQPEAPQQQQPAQVLEQLLFTCLVSESSYMAWQLGQHPAAASVGKYTAHIWLAGLGFLSSRCNSSNCSRSCNRVLSRLTDEPS